MYIKSILIWELGILIKFYFLSVNELFGGVFGWLLFFVGMVVIIFFLIGFVLGIFVVWKWGSCYDIFIILGMLVI